MKMPKIHFFLSTTILICFIISVSALAQDVTSIQDIRKQYNYINNTELTKKSFLDVNLYKDIRPTRYPHEGNEITGTASINIEAYFDKNKLVKIVVKYDGEVQDLISEYYYADNDVFFIFKSNKEYNDPKWADAHDKANFSLSENRFYFVNESLVRWVNPDGEMMEIIEDHEEYAELLLSDAHLYAEFVTDGKI